MQYQPDHYLAQLSPGRLPLHALNVILVCCCVSSLVVYALKINLNALIVYANGIFIMLYLLCMLAGCRLLKGRCYALAVTGCLLCLLCWQCWGGKAYMPLSCWLHYGCFYRSENAWRKTHPLAG